MAGGAVPNFAEVLVARADDDHPAILFEDETISYRALIAEAAARAALLRDARRDGPFHVGVLLENVPEFVFWLGAAALAGAAVVGINPTRRGGELAHDIRHTDCQLIVTDEAGAGTLLDGSTSASPPDRDAHRRDRRVRRALARSTRARRCPSTLPDARRPCCCCCSRRARRARRRRSSAAQGRLAGAGRTTIKMFEVDRDDVLY